MEKSEIVEFGKWVRLQRKQHKLTQQQLASELNLASGTISAIELGTIAAIGPKMEAAIRDYFGNKEKNTSQNILQNNNLGMNREMIIKLAEVVAADDFQEKVSSLRKTLDCSAQEAIFILFNNEIKKLIK